MLETVSPSSRKHRALSVAVFESEAFFDFRIESIIGFAPTRSLLLQSAIGGAGLASRVCAPSHITNRWSALEEGKVPENYVKVCGAQLRR